MREMVDNPCCSMEWQCHHSEHYEEEPKLSLPQCSPSYLTGFLEFPDSLVHFLLSQDTSHRGHFQHCILLEVNVSEGKVFLFVC